MIRALEQIVALMAELHSLREAGFDHSAIALPRDDLALKMLCAFNGCPPKLAPNGWRYFPNAATKRAWCRVAEAAREHLGGEARA